MISAKTLSDFAPFSSVFQKKKLPRGAPNPICRSQHHSLSMRGNSKIICLGHGAQYRRSLWQKKNGKKKLTCSQLKWSQIETFSSTPNPPPNHRGRSRIQPTGAHTYNYVYSLKCGIAIEKGRDLTQSYDKCPYTNRNVKRAK